MKHLLVIAALLLAAAPATAGGGMSGDARGMTGDEYLRECASPNKNPACYDFTEAMEGWRRFDNHSPFCFDNPLEPERFRQVTIDFLRGHPKRRHEPVSQPMGDAFWEIWACSLIGLYDWGPVQRTPVEFGAPERIIRRILEQRRGVQDGR
jgi:hypothetical protein